MGRQSLLPKWSLPHSGPVGLAYAFRLARVQYRMREMPTRIDLENQAHRNALRQLNDELGRLVSLQQGLNIAAAQFRNCCDPAPKRSPALDGWPDLTTEI